MSFIKTPLGNCYFRVTLKKGTSVHVNLRSSAARIGTWYNLLKFGRSQEKAKMPYVLISLIPLDRIQLGC